LRSEGGQNKKVTVINIDEANHSNACKQDCAGDLVGRTRLVDHVDQTQADCLDRHLGRVLGEPSTIESCQVTISCAEIKLHKLNREENSGHDLWCHAKVLTGQGGRAVCNLIVAVGKILTCYCQGMQCWHEILAKRQQLKDTWMVQWPGMLP